MNQPGVVMKPSAEPAKNRLEKAPALILVGRSGDTVRGKPRPPSSPLAGAAAGLVSEMMGAGEAVSRMVAEAERVLASLRR